MNQPGTHAEYPNWQVPLADGNGDPVLLDDLVGLPFAADLAAAVRGHAVRLVRFPRDRPNRPAQCHGRRHHGAGPAARPPRRSPRTHPDDGGESGAGLSVIETLLIFVGIPAALFLAVVILVNASSRARGPRYRPGLGWWAAPIWFNGPDDADAAVRTATATTGGGGASARW